MVVKESMTLLLKVSISLRSYTVLHIFKQVLIWAEKGNHQNFEKYSWQSCRTLTKDWRLKKETKVNPLFLSEKKWELTLSFYLHFPWLYGPWKQQRVLKKYPFWKHDSWFSSEVSKLTSVFYPRNDAFSDMKKSYFKQ